MYTTIRGFQAHAHVKDRPLVTIGVPVYNGEAFIEHALASVRAQTYSNLDIVVCDNCSADRTQEICLREAARDSRIRYHRYADHVDSAASFCRTLALAKGAFFIWACADDIRPTDSVDHLMTAMLRSPQAVMAHGEIVVTAVQSTKRMTNCMNLMNDEPYKRIKHFVRGFEHNAMIYGLYKTDVLKRACFRLHYGRDFHLCLQMCLFGPVEYCEAPMLIYKEKNLHPHLDPMGPERKVTLLNLMTGGRTLYKAWTTFLYAVRYLLKPSEVRLTTRAQSVCAFVTEFTARYGKRLSRDGVLILAQPLCWLLTWAWSVAKRSSVLLALGRKLKERVTSA
jgi:glycosyltransferase involved in cell wall biosynthesis